MRRGHGSSKVPGVKLRPAAPTKSCKQGESSKQPGWLQPSNVDDIDSTEILKSCKKPFVGVVVCASGLTDKVNVFQQAVQLGAQTSSDLTDRVTHLICESPGSAKYNYCVEHGIPILQPSWITDAYGKWLNGELIDIMKSASIHRFPTFNAVRLCITGISDTQRRKEIRRQLEKNGGKFVETLGKEVQLTHLLCGSDRDESAGERSVTPKMQFVMNENIARAEKVHLVWDDWFWDCLEFKGIVNERDYLATGPRPQLKIRREASPLLAPIASSADQNQRRPATMVSPMDTNLDAEEAVKIKRVPETTALLWEGALKRRGFEMKDGKLTRSPSKSRASSSMSSEQTPSDSPLQSSRSKGAMPLRGPTSRTESSLTAAFKRTKSFAAKGAESETTKASFQRVLSTPAAAFQQACSSSAIGSSSAPPKEDCPIPEGERNLFLGLRFRALGEASGPKLTDALELRGGTVLTGLDDEVDYVIVRLAGGSTFYRNESKDAERAKYRTECWIEQCMFEERICASDEHPAFVPLRFSTPIPGADKLVLHISGLTPSEKTPSVRLIKAIGAHVTDHLSRHNTHLICPCGSGPKFNKAQEWNIPVLNLQWLYATVKCGAIQDVTDYLVTTVASATGAPEGGMMTDITNSDFVQGSSRSKASGKSSDRSQSSNSSAVVAAVASLTAVHTPSSDAWADNGLLSESAPEHPPTSSPALSSHSHDAGPMTPSPVRRSTVAVIAMPGTPTTSPFASPSKLNKITKRNLDRIPSSATPSPLKMPSKGTRMCEPEGATASASPATATASTLSGESASVLKEAIASLLGKRSSSDDAETESLGHAHAQAQGPTTRSGKRSKPPPRTKSRQDASTRMFSRTTSMETLGRTGSGFPFDFTVAPGSAGRPGDMVESPSELSVTGTNAAEAPDESMRVTYEDPSQRAEERRLKSLISGDAMDADAEQETIPKNGEKTAVEDSAHEVKKPQPRPRRRGRNLVRRATTNGPDQS